jgi:hypothetical protein
MAKCPNGHRNPKNQELCAVCDALMVDAERRPLSTRTWLAIIAASIVAAVVLATILGVLVTNRSDTEIAATPTTTEVAKVQQWWSGAREHFDALQGAVDDTREGIKRIDEAALEKSCQQLHDAGIVALRAHMPTPDPDLTAEIDAAINDAHEAAHMCLAAASGSLNSYVGEFSASLDQVDLHLSAARDIINKSFLTA